MAVSELSPLLSESWDFYMKRLSIILTAALVLGIIMVVATTLLSQNGYRVKAQILKTS